MQFFPVFSSPSEVSSYLNLARCVNCSCLWRGRWFWGWRWGHRLTWLGAASSRGPSPWSSASRSPSRGRSACSPGKGGENPKSQGQTGSSVSSRINKPWFHKFLAPRPPPAPPTLAVSLVWLLLGSVCAGQSEGRDEEQSVLGPVGAAGFGGADSRRRLPFVVSFIHKC